MYEYKDLEVVVYDRDSKGFICSYCCNGFTVHQLREVYGLSADLAEIKHRILSGNNSSNLIMIEIITAGTGKGFDNPPVVKNEIGLK